ncbi:MAG TPA: hypothetical protein VIL53_03215 [Solirubrobacterales bacterium]|jgi:hypothetical protein
MSDPQDHSQSGFEPGGAAGHDPGAEAQRFWGEYAHRTRPGGQREDRGPAGETGNGHGSAAAHSHECLEWCPICRTADVLRASTPPELRDQIQGLQHDALVTLRALLDAYIERVGESRARGGSAVEDIPIE